MCDGRGHGEDRKGWLCADEQVHGGVRSHPPQARPAVGVELGEVAGEAVGVVAGLGANSLRRALAPATTGLGVANGLAMTPY